MRILLKFAQWFHVGHFFFQFGKRLEAFEEVDKGGNRLVDHLT